MLRSFWVVHLVEPISLPHRDDDRSGFGVPLVQTARTADATAATGAKVANYR
jgi:hypothetical protein